MKAATKRTKSFKDICSQCERISTLYLNGYGTEKMLTFAEDIFLQFIKKTVY